MGKLGKEDFIPSNIELALAGRLTLQEQILILRDAVINAALVRCCGNQCRAASLLGIHRNTMSRHLSSMKRRGSLKAILRGNATRKQPHGERGVLRAHGLEVYSAKASPTSLNSTHIR